MTSRRLEVADIFRQHGQEFLDRWGHTLSRQQHRALRDIVACRTAELGVHHVEQCDRCPNQKVVYNSCRNRHCPKCHSRARDDWLADRAKDLLPVRYCHVVFTIPHEIAPVALQNPRVVYGILFRASAEALTELAADPKRLGGKIWLPGSATHMEPTTDASSACALCRSCRRTIGRWDAMEAGA
jgi:hypothetical protein